MNVQTLKNASEAGGPVVLIVGASLATLAVIGVGHSRPSAAASGPAVTRTVTAPPITVPAPTASASVSPSSAASAEHENTASTRSVAARDITPGPGVPSGPSPRPTVSQPPAPCGGVLSVRALSASACLKLR